jgi:hypothetical protein
MYLLSFFQKKLLIQTRAAQNKMNVLKQTVRNITKLIFIPEIMIWEALLFFLKIIGKWRKGSALAILALLALWEC